MKIIGSTSHQPLSEDYTLLVGVHDTPLGKHLTIDTQWLGAKDPDAVQRQYSVTLPPHVLLRIGEHLIDEAERTPA
jgi:hypothetical protein